MQILSGLSGEFLAKLLTLLPGSLLRLIPALCAHFPIDAALHAESLVKSVGEIPVDIGA